MQISFEEFNYIITINSTDTNILITIIKLKQI